MQQDRSDGDSGSGVVFVAGGRVIDPASGTDAVMDVVIRGGRVEAMGAGLARPGSGDGAVVIEARDRIVAPGLIDPHVHLREPGGEHKETIASGTRAAVAGGFTTVCCMPNTTPALDSPEMVRSVRQRASETASCRVFAVAAATVGRGGERLTETDLLAESGAVGLSDDGDCIASAGLMLKVLQAARRCGLAFMQHCQEPTLTVGASMHAGDVSSRLGLAGWPRVAEEMIIERDVRLNRGVGARYHIQHVSSGGSIEIVRAAQLRGEAVTCEASPHHLHLTHEACVGYNTAAKMNPPLRESADVDALREAVAEGVITHLATDHAPHAVDEKGLPFEEAPFGIIGLETALPLYAEALVETGLIGWPRLIELLTLAPARLCNLDQSGIGALRVGGVGDVTVIDPAAEWVFDASRVAGKSANSPFLPGAADDAEGGRRLRGEAVAVIVGGRVALRRGGGG